MTKTPEQFIRIYKKDPDGNLHDAGCFRHQVLVKRA